jgi:hypothetical protein
VIDHEQNSVFLGVSRIGGRVSQETRENCRNYLLNLARAGLSLVGLVGADAGDAKLSKQEINHRQKPIRVVGALDVFTDHTAKKKKTENEIDL